MSVIGVQVVIVSATLFQYHRDRYPALPGPDQFLGNASGLVVSPFAYLKGAEDAGACVPDPQDQGIAVILVGQNRGA